jgi:hypothetical protein
MVLWQDKKTAVVGHQLQTIILVAEVPADPAIPCLALPGSDGKTRKRYPFIAPGGHIPNGFADLRKRTQVMMLLHLFLVMLLFETTNGPDMDIQQVQDIHPGSSG